jgi:hypothetical protein
VTDVADEIGTWFKSFVQDATMNPDATIAV